MMLPSYNPKTTSEPHLRLRSFAFHLCRCKAFNFFLKAEMKLNAAYLLPLLGGNTSPSAECLKDILGSVGADSDDDKIKLLLSEIKGKDKTELIASGREKLASVPSGGGGAAAAPVTAESKNEEKEESDDDMGFSLFD